MIISIPIVLLMQSMYDLACLLHGVVSAASALLRAEMLTDHSGLSQRVLVECLANNQPPHLGCSCPDFIQLCIP